jgi:hypothetical protein
MSRGKIVWAVVGILAALVFSPRQAQAGEVMFGTEETIHIIQPTKDPRYNLCYKTSIYFFIAGCYLADDGYVLGKAGKPKSYIPLTEAHIRELQQEGSLPTPMPKYSISFFDYLFGYSNWILVVFVVVPTTVKLARIKDHSEPEESPSTSAADA